MKHLADFNWEDYRSTVPEGESGAWRVQRVTVSPEHEAFQRLRAMIKGTDRWAPAGTYTVLTCDGSPIMTDSPDEINDHYPAIKSAVGACLINGLGLGIVAEACARLSEVCSVTVIERSPDVIQLVGPHMEKLHGNKIQIIQADAFTWQPPRGSYYCMVWHDIWDSISADNLPEMRQLREKYRRRSLWQGCWARPMCMAMDRQAKRGEQFAKRIKQLG